MTEQKLPTIIDDLLAIMENIVVLTDIDFDIVKANVLAQKSSFHENESFIAQMNQIDKDFLQSNAESIIKGKVVNNKNISFFDVNKRERFFSVSISAMDIDNKTFFFFFLQDATPISRLKMFLENDSNIFLTIIEGIPLPIFTRNEKGIYMECNKTLCDFTGKKKEDIIGHPIEDVFPQDIANIYRQADLDLMIRDRVQIYETKSFGIKGERRVIFHKAPWKNDEGEILGIVGTFFDITDQRKIEDTLVKKIEELETINNDIIVKEKYIAELKNKIKNKSSV
ncbi:MAG: PAS domain-containing protein [Patescibacteria group bacterium]|nr:PAS domain-containing protein [Patescibacteria group bacterium]